MNVSLRLLTYADTAQLASLANNERIAQYMTNQFPHPYTKKDAQYFIQMAMVHEPTHILAITANNKLAGAIGLHQQQDIMCRNAELGYWLGEKFWGMGIATQAVQQMVAYGFHHFDLVRIYARPFGNNPASARVLEKAGFMLEARIAQNILKLGVMLDELIYGIRDSVIKGS